MIEFFAGAGLFAIALLILYIAKRVNEYLYYKNINNEHYKFDDDDDER